MGFKDPGQCQRALDGDASLEATPLPMSVRPSWCAREAPVVEGSGGGVAELSLIHISEPTRLALI
eukprot:11373649-Alexandrium_andersonii.AAC.1